MAVHSWTFSGGSEGKFPKKTEILDISTSSYRIWEILGGNYPSCPHDVYGLTAQYLMFYGELSLDKAISYSRQSFFFLQQIVMGFSN